MNLFCRIDVLCKQCYNIYSTKQEVFLMRNDKYHRTPFGWHPVKLSDLPYLTLADVEKIYKVVNNHSTNGLRKFLKRAKEIAVQLPREKGRWLYQFRDEDALFKLFQEALPTELERLGIDCWGRLMQFVS